MGNRIRRLSTFAFIFTLASDWSLSAMQPSPVEVDAHILGEIQKMEQNLQPVPDPWRPIREVATKHLDMLFTAYEQSSEQALVGFDNRINFFIRQLPSAVQQVAFDKFNNIKALLNRKTKQENHLKNMSIQGMQQEAASAVWVASKPLTRQEISKIIEHKIDTPEFRGLKLCLRATMGPVPADGWFADLPKLDTVRKSEYKCCDNSKFDGEMNKLVNEFKSNESDIVILVIAAAAAARQVTQRFLFENFSKKFRNKKATIISIDSTYFQDAKKWELLPPESPFNSIEDELIDCLINLDYINEKLKISQNNVITFLKYPDVEIKLFGTPIPNDYEHNFFDYLRRFFAKKLSEKKFVFIAWMYDPTVLFVCPGLSKAYIDYKIRFPENIFFYAQEDRNTDYLPTAYVVFDPPAEKLKPLAHRFFSTFEGGTAGAFKPKIDYVTMQRLRVLNGKRPFLLCKKLNFVFDQLQDGSLHVILDDAYVSKGEIKKFWDEYIELRTKKLAQNEKWYIKSYATQYGTNEQAATKKVNEILHEFMPVACIDQEPTTWREAVEKSGFMSWDEYQKVVPN